MTDDDVARIVAKVTEEVKKLLVKHDKRVAERQYRTNETLRSLRRQIERQDERHAKGAAVVASIFAPDDKKGE